MWVLIDNYDSFTHILHHYLLQLHEDVRVYKHDAISLDELERLNPERFIISPGPQTPKEAGITLSLIQTFYKTHPILGICLGHQAIGMFLEANLVRARYPMHGKVSLLNHQQQGLFAGLPPALEVMRYHSLVLENWDSKGIRPLAFSQDDNALMAFDHELYPLVGLQFHPESVLTQHGLVMLQNWKNLYL